MCVTSRISFIHLGCTVRGGIGNGKSQGTCKNGSNCYEDGVCRSRCTVNGGKGDGISKGSCQEGFLCYKEGICLKEGKFVILTVITISTPFLEIIQYEET